MDREDRRMVGLGIVISLIILAALLFFLWGNFLNQGKLKVTSSAPFTIEFLKGDKIECSESPCIIEDKIGNKDFIISKEGFKSKVVNSKIKLWRTNEIKVELDMTPQLTEIPSMPEPKTIPKYFIEFDENKRTYSLVEETKGIPIIYFPKEIKEPKIIGNERFILVIGKDGSYKIDVKNKSRTKIDADFSSILDGKWSPDGKYFVFSKESSSLLQIYSEEKEIIPFGKLSSLEQVDWTYNNSLIFSENNILGEYSPNSNEYTEIYSLDFPVNEIFLEQNGHKIYFQSGEKSYQLILRKF